ncbi:hypothetical protein JDO7802_02619 [Jannaschia donghaensis]|uniref:Uncharacterized protein n=1 Tax=Jannaschia donghaensis TaxID=420998 RepID=A0A0M6YL20_9RHOB|nr:hypothetical protein JDO7802_02619 [Jannaschia donghaensis]
MADLAEPLRWRRPHPVTWAVGSFEIGETIFNRGIPALERIVGGVVDPRGVLTMVGGIGGRKGFGQAGKLRTRVGFGHFVDFDFSPVHHRKAPAFLPK